MTMCRHFTEYNFSACVENFFFVRSYFKVSLLCKTSLEKIQILKT